MKKIIFCFLSTLILASCGATKESDSIGHTVASADVPVANQPDKVESPSLKTEEQPKKYQLSKDDREKYTPTQQKTLEKHIAWANDPEFIAEQANRIQNERKTRKEKLKAELKGNGLSYELGKGHMVMSGQDYQFISEDRCVSMEDIIKSNPSISPGGNRIRAPFPGLVLQLPDHACSDKTSPSIFDSP